MFLYGLMAKGSIVLCLVSFLLFSCLIVSSYAECGSGISRIRVTGRQGIIVNPSRGSVYKDNSKCSWYITGDTNVTRSIHLKFTSYDIECLWDRLSVFNGDSIHDTLYSSVTGAMYGEGVTEEREGAPLALPLAGSGDGSGSGGSGGGGDVPLSSLVVTVPGSSALVYFFSDAGVAGKGFNVTYWTTGCIDECWDRGVCQEGACQCDPSWVGPYCQYSVCPNGCSGNGRCDHTHNRCVCDDNYTGDDCSISTDSSHWSVLEGSDYTARAGHTSVMWGDYVWVYGGYRYGNDNEEGSGFTSYDLVRRHIDTNEWEEVPIMQLSWLPRARHSHSAAVYNNSMYIYGGALVENEDIINELWQFDFVTLSWQQLNRQQSDNGSNNISTSDVITNRHGNPIAVKYHSSVVVQDKMLILFGYSNIANAPINYIQSYDFHQGVWSIRVPRLPNGMVLSGRMGHTSVYLPILGVVYIHGGGGALSSQLLSYSVGGDEWTELTSSDVAVMFHSTVASEGEGLLLTYGGHTDTCLGQEIQVYNIACDQWTTLSQLPGQPESAGRFGHSAVTNSNDSMLVLGGYNGVTMSEDVLLLTLVNCTVMEDEEECLNETLCVWSEREGCTLVGTQGDAGGVSMDCEYDPCSIHHGCRQCNIAVAAGNISCYWNTTTALCTSGRGPSGCGQEYLVECGEFSDCFRCHADGCSWTNETCVASNDSNATPMSCDPVVDSCLSHTSCKKCSGQCLWCDSAHKCVHDSLYPFSFLYGQCLGWTNDNSCPADSCSEYNTCTRCHGDPGCGWCRDPSDTGLGTCGEGGYRNSLDQSDCPTTHWFYEQCPLCNCNGHSTCVNQTICEECRDMTSGLHCENCIDTFYGVPENGRNCSVCDCNGYNPTCNSVNGSCTCLDAGVTGDRCASCDAIGSYSGDPVNFCHYQMSVGFIYTFVVSEARQIQTYYTAVPRSGSRLNVKFDITRNPFGTQITVQYFIGRVSDNYLLLLNLTDPITVSGTQSITHTFEPYTSNGNGSDFFTFAQSSITGTPNYTQLLLDRFPGDYSNSLWDGDMGLVIYVYNQSPSMQYKITIDQTDLIFLAYFFVTFIICFALLLGVFVLGWVLKRKLELRAIRRAQHIEMQRRVRRPFARLKAVVEPKPNIHAKQNSSYVSVETCKDSKAAILSLLIRLPADKSTGKPSVNRTGVGFGSTLVRMNQGVKGRRDKKLRHRQQSSTVLIDEHST